MILSPDFSQSSVWKGFPQFLVQTEYLHFYYIFFCDFVYNIFWYGFLKAVASAQRHGGPIQTTQKCKLTVKTKDYELFIPFCGKDYWLSALHVEPKLITFISQSQFLTTGSELIKRNKWFMFLLAHWALEYCKRSFKACRISPLGFNSWQ